MKVSKCRWLMATMAVFIFIFAFEYLYHGIFLVPTYEATASLWRPMIEMEAMFPFCLATKLAFSILLVWIFSKNYEGKGITEGLRYGIMLGLLIGVLDFRGYMYLPISVELALAWLGGGILTGLGAGVILSLTFKPCKKAS